MLTSGIFYRLSPFHPLASYPAPTFGKITKWYHACFVVNGPKQYKHFYRMHKYGDIVRIGPNKISVHPGLMEWKETLEDRFVVKVGKLPVIVERRF